MTGPDILLAATTATQDAGLASVWSGWLQSVVMVVIFLLGLGAHYVKSEEKQQSRYENLAKWLEQHERRICDLEGRAYQPSGLTTYIPRPECDIRHGEIKKELKEIVREVRAIKEGKNDR